MKRLASTITLLLILQLAWLSQRSLAETGAFLGLDPTALAGEDEITGVVVDMQRKVKDKQAAAAPGAESQADEITGVVIAEPRETSPGITQFRMCTDDKKFVSVCIPSPCTMLKNAGCGTDQRITIDSCMPTMPGCSAAAAGAVHPAKPLAAGQMPVCTMEHAMQCGQVSCEGLIGDGTTTSHCLMPCTNKTDQPITVCVPQNQCFEPDQNDCQSMATTADTCISMGAHETCTATLPTMCISPHSVKPPPAKGRSYKPKAHRDNQFYKFCDRTLTVSRYMDEEHYYDQAPLPAGRRRETICQLAQWIEQGKRSGDPKDAISPDTIRDDLIEKGHMDPAAIKPEVMDRLNLACRKIYKMADMTNRLAQDKRVDVLLAGSGAGNID